VHIVCPHCTTAYAIDMAALGTAGRTVRCSRCKEVWLARPEDAVAALPMRAMATAGHAVGQTDPAAEWDRFAREEVGNQPPHIESPPIAGDWNDKLSSEDTNWDADSDASEGEGGGSRTGWLQNLLGRPRRSPRSGKAAVTLPTACAAMGALALALIVWRADVVRLLPQTGNFYRLVNLDVNLRGLSFKDVKVTTETVEGKPVLVIEGTIVSQARKSAEVPRLRFSVRDAQGAEIYAWNAVLEQTVLKPGDRAPFKSRLASPPAEGRAIDIRFFNKHDIAGGSV
jgi:predicted Zn finger-like uncharacterized protein